MWVVFSFVSHCNYLISLPIVLRVDFRLPPIPAIYPVFQDRVQAAQIDYIENWHLFLLVDGVSMF